MKLFDTKVKIKLRLFFILGWTALVANTVGFLANLIFYGWKEDTIFYGVCALIMFGLGMIEEKTGNESLIVGIILVIVNVVEFPVMYYLYGAGRIVYMILGIIAVLVFSSKKQRVILSAITIVYDAVIIILSVVYPSDYVVVTPESDLGAALASFIIVAVSMLLIIILIVKQYETQNQELAGMADELKKMAERDPLTLLYNRRYLTEYLEAHMEKKNLAFSVVLLDLDDFKKVNDTFGHVYGDEVLQNFSRIIEKASKEKGIAARFGGEEFMLVLDTVLEQEIENIMAVIRKEFAEYSMETRGICLTFSGGAEMFHQEDRITKLFNAADEKLYQAKKHGKNTVIYH